MMRSLSASELLDIWDQGQDRSRVGRSLLLLAGALPDHTPEALAQLPIGQRDGYLLDLRQAMFGRQFTGLVACPKCCSTNEIDLDFTQLRHSPRTPLPASLNLELEGYQVEFRLPTSADLESLSPAHADQMKQALLARCLVSIRRGASACSLQTLPQAVTQAVMAIMSQADPQADLQFSLLCSECQHPWQTGFDIVSFLWREIDLWARRTLEEIHQLARAYGWREADILALSARRRQYYLELNRS